MKKIFSLIICFSLALCLAFLGSGASVHAKENATNEFKVEGRGAVLIDAKTGMVLFSQNETSRQPIASMNKIMTLLLTFEAIDNGTLDENGEIMVSENASSMGGSQVFLDANTNYKTSDLIKSVVVSSANDASVALAEAISGTEQNFVVKMNEKAKELKLENTNFANATGLPAAEGYSCASDVATMFKHLVKHKNYFNYSTIYLDTLTHPSGRETELANTNKLIRFYNGCDAGKTGSTNEAKFCLCATAKRGDMRLIACVIGSENSKIRNAQVSNLFNYGFNNYKSVNIVSVNDAFEVPVLKANKQIVLANAVEDYSQIVANSKKVNVEVKPIFIENIKAPLKKGDKVGELIITNNNEVIKKIDIVASENLKTVSYGNSIINLLKQWCI